VDDGLLITNKIGMNLKLIPAGEFLMGSADRDPEAKPDEKPQHKVRIARPFYLGVYEVTQAEYKVVMVDRPNPSYFSAIGDGKTQVVGKDTDRFPVENVSWFDAIAFCNKLSEREGLKPCYTASNELIASGTGYRLPTVAEWEYACRAGSTTKFAFGDRLEPTMANFDRTQPLPVGSYSPNELGLFDMHGNMWEWCQDWYHPGYYANSPATDPLNSVHAPHRVFRGGTWRSILRDCRSANRDGNAPGLRFGGVGFRVARVWLDK
jgi:formylglycine-generating enzyme required for sulfatase activity